MDTCSGGGGVDHRGDQNRTGRPDSTGRVAGLSRLCTARALSVDSGDLLRSLASTIRFGGGVWMYHLSPCIVALPNKRVQSDAAAAAGYRDLNRLCDVLRIEA